MSISIQIKTNFIKIILIFYIIILTHSVKSDELITNCSLTFNNLVCINYQLKNDIKVNLQDDPYKIIIDFEKSVKIKLQSKINISNFIINYVLQNQPSFKSTVRLHHEIDFLILFVNIFFNKFFSMNFIW